MNYYAAMRGFVMMLSLLFSQKSFSQQTRDTSSKAASNWADSVFKSLSNDEKIAQLMVVRLSSIDLKTMKVTFFDEKVATLVRQYNIGGVCIFQGGPEKQAAMINALQSLAKTPILMCIDAEWGVGQRLLDSVLSLPKQMMLGAMKDERLLYRYGQIVAEQCKRFGVQVNYAPVVDVNNNPNNPVINDRSFGEDKYKVARFATQYMKGMQDMGVMACAKHFPGHGDVAVDSHYDLPVINKTIEQLDSLELYPFRQVFRAGISSTMIAHLYIPAIDNTTNKATSLSKNNVSGLLRNDLNFQGITFTDALDMKAVTKFFPDGQASVEALIAGNDMLCLPEDIPVAIAKVKEAIANNKLGWDDIEMHCRKVLLAKYQYGLADLKPIIINNLSADLNSKVPAMTRLIAENAITLLSKNNSAFFPLSVSENNKPADVAYVGIGINSDNAFAARMRKDYNADVFYLEYNNKDSIAIARKLDSLSRKYKKIVIGIHNLTRTPVTNFGLSKPAINFVSQLQQRTNSISFLFGNAYAVKNFCNANNLVLCYEDDPVIQNTAVDMLEGNLSYKGVLPVTVCDQYKFGFGLAATNGTLPFINPNQAGSDIAMTTRIDSIANDAIASKAIPGCVVLVAKAGRIVYEKAYGYYTYDNIEPVTINSVYDMASVTKICATTLAVMKLYDEGKLDLKKKLGDYLPLVKGTNKEKLVIEKLLLHQGGLSAFIPFYKETLDTAGIPLNSLYRWAATDTFSIPVAKKLFLRNDWRDTIYKRILSSPLGAPDKYLYSDNDFIFLGKVVESIAGVSLDEYVRKNFYSPMSLEATGFLPLKHMPLSRIVPTQDEKEFRLQLLRGDVHDQGAAMMGGVAGHAGLFSDAYDIACIMQMLLNGGTFNGKKYLQKETVDLFTSYQTNTSRRGYGFDKPEKDNKTRAEPYPTLSASPATFGHTGYTGTCAWADPEKNLVFIFLSNRVNPSDSDLFLKMNIRPKIHETIYRSLSKK
ncbi:MAG: glycoside hydrolase family 3 N-terminal domain-containing protein [Ferruginibacter sp.]